MSHTEEFDFIPYVLNDLIEFCEKNQLYISEAALARALTLVTYETQMRQTGQSDTALPEEFVADPTLLTELVSSRKMN